MNHKPPEKRVKIKKSNLEIIQKLLKKRGFSIVDVEKKIGYCFENALYHGRQKLTGKINS